MSILNGSNLIIFASLPDDNYPIACQRGVNVTITSDNPDATCKQDNGYTSLIYGKRNFEISGDALQSFTEDVDMTFLFDCYKNKEFIDFSIGNSLLTDVYFTGQALITSIEANSPMEDIATYTFTLQGTATLQSLVS
jgi:predicted secreted protein